MGIIGQIVDYMSVRDYSGVEVPRLVEAFSKPVDDAEVSALAAQIGDPDAARRVATTAERILHGLHRKVQAETVGRGGPMHPDSAMMLAGAAIRTARDVDAGALPYHEPTLANRLAVDYGYQAMVAAQAQTRRGERIDPGNDTEIYKTGGPRAVKHMDRLVGDMSEEDLRRFRLGHVSDLPQAVVADMARASAKVVIIGSHLDRDMARFRGRGPDTLPDELLVAHSERASARSRGR